MPCGYYIILKMIIITWQQITFFAGICNVLAPKGDEPRNKVHVG